jgi:hypothetical protein
MVLSLLVVLPRLSFCFVYDGAHSVSMLESIEDYMSDEKIELTVDNANADKMAELLWKKSAKILQEKILSLHIHDKPYSFKRERAALSLLYNTVWGKLQYIGSIKLYGINSYGYEGKKTKRFHSFDKLKIEKDYDFDYLDKKVTDGISIDSLEVLKKKHAGILFDLKYSQLKIYYSLGRSDVKSLAEIAKSVLESSHLSDLFRSGRVEVKGDLQLRSRDDWDILNKHKILCNSILSSLRGTLHIEIPIDQSPTELDILNYPTLTGLALYGDSDIMPALLNDATSSHDNLSFLGIVGPDSFKLSEHKEVFSQRTSIKTVSISGNKVNLNDIYDENAAVQLNIRVKGNQILFKEEKGIVGKIDLTCLRSQCILYTTEKTLEMNASQITVIGGNIQFMLSIKGGISIKKFNTINWWIREDTSLIVLGDSLIEDDQAFLKDVSKRDAAKFIMIQLREQEIGCGINHQFQFKECIRVSKNSISITT